MTAMPTGVPSRTAAYWQIAAIESKNPNAKSFFDIVLFGMNFGFFMASGNRITKTTKSGMAVISKREKPRLPKTRPPKTIKLERSEEMTI